ncbi:MAG: carbohydrate ABC transporter permease [Spirochaetes bacterium]|nr:carbohydrate ABC transporter permease [Spirochaetota bacterium]
MKRHGNAALNIVVLLVCCFFAFPVIWILMMSLKTPADAFSLPPKLLFKPIVENYQNVFRSSFFMKTYFNSIIIALGASFLSIAIGIPAAYVITRFKFKGHAALSFWVLVTRMAPASAMVVAFFMILWKLKLLDTYLGIVAVYMTMNVGYVIWMMRGFIQSIPEECEEAAIVDGCNRFGAFLHVVLPLSAPGISAVSIMTFIFNWNEFLYALILTRNNLKTAPIAVLSYISSEGIRWGEMSAAAIMIILPVLFLSLLIQRHIISGLTMGAIK